MNLGSHQIFATNVAKTEKNVIKLALDPFIQSTSMTRNLSLLYLGTGRPLLSTSI